MQRQCYKNLNAVAQFQITKLQSQTHVRYTHEMSNVASEETAVLEGLFARCCFTGLYRKSVLIIFLDRIKNYT